MLNTLTQPSVQANAAALDDPEATCIETTAYGKKVCELKTAALADAEATCKATTEYGQQIYKLETITAAAFKNIKQPFRDFLLIRDCKRNIAKLTELFKDAADIFHEKEFLFLHDGETKVTLKNGKSGTFKTSELTIFQDADTSPEDLAGFAYYIGFGYPEDVTSCHKFVVLLDRYHIDESAFVDFLVAHTA
jgi:hypothetical protein